mgnify:CR=1 FL=1
MKSQKYKKRMSFHLKCDDDILSRIDVEAKAAGYSRTAYLNKVLASLFRVPPFLTAGNRLQELDAYSKLLTEETMKNLPKIAREQRRCTDQMLLWLIDEGIERLKSRSFPIASRIVKPE